MQKDLLFNLQQSVSTRPKPVAEVRSLANQPEPKSFLVAALAWHGSVTPIVLPRVVFSSVFAAVICGLAQLVDEFYIPITPFEYSGAVRALILVMRVNAGHDRWWEARKIWGSIVNQSRNLAIVVSAYGGGKKDTVEQLLKLIAAWPHVMRQSLRNEKDLREVVQLVGPEEADAIRRSQHMPIYVGQKIAKLLDELRRHRMDRVAFHRAETERSQLIDAIGACERIRNTRMPLVLVIKTRRFIMMFLALLPLALVERIGWFTPFIMALASYPLFSLDEIGAELQNPFSEQNLSHLPLNDICNNITDNVMALVES